MITNAPAHVFVADAAIPSEDVRSTGPVGFLAWFQQTLCSLHGHDAILQYERNRIFLRCTSCGHETPGWEVETSSAMMRRRPPEPRAVRGTADLAVARKIA
jgi:hypothetical protein